MYAKEFLKLSGKEQHAYNLLRRIEQRVKKQGDQSIWQIAVINATKHGDADCFRHLIKQLISQANDCPACMKKILGPQAYKAVMDLEECSLTVDACR